MCCCAISVGLWASFCLRLLFLYTVVTCGCGFFVRWVVMLWYFWFFCFGSVLVGWICSVWGNSVVLIVWVSGSDVVRVVCL